VAEREESGEAGFVEAEGMSVERTCALRGQGAWEIASLRSQ